MPFYTYILRSITFDRLYIGHTQDIDLRIQQHNDGLTRSTVNKGPWEILHYEIFQNREEARALEHRLKKWKNPTRVREWITQKKSPENTDKHL